MLPKLVLLPFLIACWGNPGSPSFSSSDQATLTVDTQLEGATCDADGTLTVSGISGGTPPYTVTADNLPVTIGVAQLFPAGRYVVDVSDATGINRQVTVLIPNACIRPYEAITPNDDGLNDEWDIPGIAQFPDAYVIIYNRYGQPVYRSEGTYEPWNGQMNGSGPRLPSSSYHYVIFLNGKDDTDERYIVSGHLTLIR